MHHLDGGYNDATPIVLTVVMEFYMSGGATGVYHFGERAANFYQSQHPPSREPLKQGRLPCVVFHSIAWHCSVEPEEGSFPYEVSLVRSLLMLQPAPLYPHMSAMLLPDFKIYHLLHTKVQHQANTKLKPVAGSIPFHGKDGS